MKLDKHQPKKDQVILKMANKKTKKTTETDSKWIYAQFSREAPSKVRPKKSKPKHDEISS